MTIQNLTPQLRTRLSRLERLVGLFVSVATLLFLFGLCYYVYRTAKNKGWFLIKAPYYTFVDHAAGMKEGHKVRLMGFDVGEITKIEAQPPFDPWNVYVEFYILEPYYGYLWKDSRARVAGVDFLGGRAIEVTKGQSINPVPTYLFHELREVPIDAMRELVGKGRWRSNEAEEDPATGNRVAPLYSEVTGEMLDRLAGLGRSTVHVFNEDVSLPRIAAIFVDQEGRYTNFTGEAQSKGYFLPPDEMPALTERLERVVDLVEQSVPNILGLTNRVAEALTNVTAMASRAEALLAELQPAATNLATITGQLREPNGSLGEWLLPADVRRQAEAVLASAEQVMRGADDTLSTVRTNAAALSQGVMLSLENLALMTSNLNAQVQANGFIVGDLSELIRDTDNLVQGLKRHWLLQGAFDPATNAAPASALEPTRGDGL